MNNLDYLKVRYIYKEINGDDTFSMVYDFKEIENGTASLDKDRFLNAGYSLIGKDLSEGHVDLNGSHIFEGDIIELINEAGEKIHVVCKFGTITRKMHNKAVVCITGFYFEEIGSQRQTFPVARNYCGLTDYEIFKIIGNIRENKKLLEVTNE